MTSSNVNNEDNVSDRTGSIDTGRISYRTKEKMWRYSLNLLMIICVFFLAFPLYWMIVTSFRPSSEIYADPSPLLPRSATFENYIIIFTQTNVPTFFINSTIVALGVVALTTTAATLGGYGLTRVDFPYKKSIARFILFGYMFPAILLSIPMYILWQELGILNSYIGLILAQTAITLPFSLWLMWKFFQTVPISLEESAQMAGATRFQAFYEIALPLAKPGITAIALFSFSISWGEYTIPKILMTETARWPLTVGLDTLVHQHAVVWEQIMAASVIMLLPAFVFVFFLQRSLIKGFRVGDVG